MDQEDNFANLGYCREGF